MVWVAIITQSGARRAKQIESEAAPYAQLAQRVSDLEKADEAKSKRIAELRDEVEELRQARDEDRAYIRRVLAAWSQHLPDVIPPQPIPQWYYPHPSQQPKGGSQ